MIQAGPQATVRYPGDPKAQQTLTKAIEDFYNNPDNPVNPEKNLQERVAYILLSYQRYGPMSNNLYRENDVEVQTANAEIWGSMEDIHNTIHDITGGNGGHMSSLETSAFDPIFWLHHTYLAPFMHLA